MGTNNIKIVPTTDDHLPALWDILKEWPEFWEGDAPVSYDHFVAFWKMSIVDSLSGFDNGELVMCGCLDHLFIPVYATIMTVKKKGWGSPGQVIDMARKGIKMFFDKYNIEALRVFIKEDHPSSIKMVKNIGFSYEGMFRHWKKINGVWTDFICASILRGETNGNKF